MVGLLTLIKKVMFKQKSLNKEGGPMAKKKKKKKNKKKNKKKKKKR